jgi:hypothetical protein
LHRRIRSQDDADHKSTGAKVAAVYRQQREDDAESDEVNEHRKEDNQDGRFSHERNTLKNATRPIRAQSNMVRV